jgi:hypothetical protein
MFYNKTPLIFLLVTLVGSGLVIPPMTNPPYPLSHVV